MSSVALESKRREIRQLTGVRIFAALWVVLYHLKGWIVELVPGLAPAWSFMDSGFIAVDLFFVLSGVIIAYQYFDRVKSPRQYVDFMFKRFARLYPVHLFMLFVFLAMIAGSAILGAKVNEPEKFTPLGFLLDVTLLRSWVTADLGWNVPAWSISAEWLAYALFPLTIWIIALLLRGGRGTLIAAVPVLVVLFGLAAWAFPTFDGMPIPALRVLIAFALGVALCRLIREVHSRVLFGWLGAASLVALVVVTSMLPSGPIRAAAGLTLAAAAVAFLFVGAGPVVRFLASSPVEYGGRISYSLYMTHAFVIIVAARFLSPERFASSPLPMRLALIVVVLVAALAIAAATYQLIEKPANKILVARWFSWRKKRQGDPAAVTSVPQHS